MIEVNRKILGVLTLLTVFLASANVVSYAYAEIPEYSLSFNLVGDGVVTYNGSSPYAAGDTVVMTAYPSDGYEFSGWSGDLVSSANPEYLLMDANKVITATFTEILVHDVEAVSQIATDTSVMAGDVVDIDVTVRNNGDFTETFGLECYYDSVMLGAVLVVDLAPDETRVATYTWDTAGLPEDEYWITAWADSSEAIAEVDEGNNWCVMPLAITVITPEPTASFFWNPNPGQVREPVLFNALDSTDADGFIVTYEWDFGDRSTGFGPTPVHTYKRDKTYTVTLTVTDNDGLTDTITQDISIKRISMPEDEKIYFYAPDGEWTVDELSYTIYNDDGSLSSAQFLLSGTMWKGTGVFGATEWADFTCVDTLTNNYNKKGILRYSMRNQVILLSEGGNTLTIEVNIKLDPSLPTEFQNTGTWTVVGGTGDYAGASGRGEYHWLFQFYGTIS